MQRRKKTAPTMPLSNVENKDRNTIPIDLEQEFLQQNTENIIRRNRAGFDRLANL
jgi:hypothetical protein